MGTRRTTQVSLVLPAWRIYILKTTLEIEEELDKKEKLCKRRPTRITGCFFDPPRTGHMMMGTASSVAHREADEATDRDPAD